MSSIQIAFHQINAKLAHQIQDDLGRIGIPFEMLGHSDGLFAERLRQSEEPVLLLVTDNLLKSDECQEGLLDALRELHQKQLLFPIVADGTNAEDASVSTHIDRMVNALQYMNYWQNEWLGWSEKVQGATGTDKVEMEKILDGKRLIANQIGDVISTLREAKAVEWPVFEANAYEWFFLHLGLQQWHESYKNNAAETAHQDQAKAVEDHPMAAENHVVAEEALPETPAMTEVAQTPFVENTETAEAVTPELVVMAETHELQDRLLSEPQPLPEVDVKAMIRDAWFWINQGHSEQGLELFNLAQEQYPENEELRSESAKAHAHVAQLLAQKESAPPPPLAPPVNLSAKEAENEAKSYDLMGDMAAEKGDYLFAKYCWDRAAELDATFPGIYKKLGLMTNEHLHDYKETATAYLHKALEISPNDADILLALADLDWQSHQRDSAARRYIQATQINPALRSKDLDALYLPSVKMDTPPSAQAKDNGSDDGASAQPVRTGEASQIAMQNNKTAQTVVITGATSGIGRATAEIFAQNGYRLILTGRRAERLSEVKSHLERKYNSQVLMLPFDVRDPETVEHIFAQLPPSWQVIDVLVNNAGLAKGLAPIHEGNLAHWETMIDTNIKGLLYVTKAVTPGMVRRKSGHIINVGSSAGKEAYPNGNVYCATKFAVDALTKGMRMDLYTHGIRVSQVSPGHVEETEFALTRFDGDAEKAKIYDNFQPLRASDVAEVIYFMVTRPAHVNIQDVAMFASQQASSLLIDRSGR